MDMKDAVRIVREKYPDANAGFTFNDLWSIYWNKPKIDPDILTSGHGSMDQAWVAAAQRILNGEI